MKIGIDLVDRGGDRVVMTRYADYPAEGTPAGRCVILPGGNYTPDGPMLFFAAQAAMARGWEVRQVWWEAPQFSSDADEMAWVGDQLDAALEGYDGRVVVVAKSLGTLAAPRAAERGYDAAWLTPVLTDPVVAESLTAYPARQFVVIGSSDPYLRQDVLDALPGQCLVVPGDHILRVSGDIAATVASHDRFIRAFDEWLGR